jgi:hypothetical protein
MVTELESPEKVVGLEDNKTSESEVNQGNEESEIEQLKRALSEKEELITFMKDQSKKAFEKRDKVKDEIRKLSKTDDKVEYIETLKKQNKELEDRIAIDDRNKVIAKKLDVVKRIAKEKGLQEIYFDKIDKFVDVDDIMEGKEEITAKMQIDIMMSSFPDLFGTNASSKIVGQATGKAPSTYSKYSNNLQEQYEAEVMKGTQADMSVLHKLATDAEALGFELKAGDVWKKPLHVIKGKK